ncbi:MAG TPA: NAD-dependent epimerase/dehydratase family protein [Candidatus Dormibacteraeota bacterium]|nr:NAD-dependent epimerase/dehydratase family protein [Candidatus Dormibacteraeota bacterium]
MTPSRFAAVLGVARPPPIDVTFISGDDKLDGCTVNEVEHFIEREPLISVVIPTTNESSNLPHVLVEIPDDVYEVILVDGHSIDRTVEVARALRPDIQVIHQTGAGKGNALMQGFARARGDIVVMLDADGSTSPEEIPRFIGALRSGADFAKGSRFLPGGGSADITTLRRIGNRALTRLVNALYGTRYTDLCYGYNAFWRHCLPLLQVDCDGFEVETLINIRSARRGLTVVEVPSYESTRLHGTSGLRVIRDGWRVLRTIVHERLDKAHEPPATSDLSSKPMVMEEASMDLSSKPVVMEEASIKGASRETVLVTGGCGFIGSRLSALLAADGRRVLVYDNLSRAGVDGAMAAGVPNVALERGDVRDARALRRVIAANGVKTVFHLAAMQYAPACEKAPLECVSINVGGTQAVLNACEGTSVSAIVFTSSAAVYAPAADAVNEAAAIAPIDVYGHTKLWGEQLLRLFHRRTGMAIGIARLFNVYGPGDTNPHLASVIMQAQGGSVITLGNLSTQHDYVYIDDVAKGLMMLARSSHQRGWLLCNLGSGRAVDGATVVATLERLLGRPFVRHDAARIHANGHFHLLSDASLALATLGWEATTPFSVGLAEAVRRPLANFQTEDLLPASPRGR